MKKISLITILMTCILLFFSNISTSYAAEVSSKVTGILIESTEATSSESQHPSIAKELLENNTELLPQTGAESNLNTLRMGFLFILSAWMVSMLIIRRNSHENE